MSGWSIDRIEEGWAVCEGPDDEMIRLEVSRLPAGVREGDCLFLDGDGRWQVDEQLTRQRRAKCCKKAFWCGKKRQNACGRCLEKAVRQSGRTDKERRWQARFRLEKKE